MASLLPFKRSYAVVWSEGDAIGSGRLEPYADRFDLQGREGRVTIRFSDLAAAALARGPRERLRGLPVLALRRRSGAAVRVASLEGVGVLHELVQHVERAGLAVAD